MEERFSDRRRKTNPTTNTDAQDQVPPASEKQVFAAFVSAIAPLFDHDLTAALSGSEATRKPTLLSLWAEPSAVQPDFENAG